jgi:uncharacterized protein (DUF433 family)
VTITSDPDVLGGEPRIDGTRVGVRHVATRVVEGDQTPAYVSDQFDLPMADVHEALSYYDANVDEICAIQREQAAAAERTAENGLKPKETV